MKLFAILFLIFSTTVVFGQTISTHTLNYINNILINDGQFLSVNALFNLKDNNLETTKHYFHTDLIDNKVFNTDSVKIYFVWMGDSHSKSYILVEKIDNKIHKSSYIIFGEKYDINELNEMFVFFDKYKFSLSTTAKCYEVLIRAGYNFGILNGAKIIYADSLFKD